MDRQHSQPQYSCQIILSVKRMPHKMKQFLDVDTVQTIENHQESLQHSKNTPKAIIQKFTDHFPPYCIWNVDELYMSR